MAKYKTYKSLQSFELKDQGKSLVAKRYKPPNTNDDGIWIHQDAWFHLAHFDAGVSKEYAVKKEGNGVYVFVMEGKAKIGDQILGKRDGFGIWKTDTFTLEAVEDSEVLLMEVPMELPD